MKKSISYRKRDLIKYFNNVKINISRSCCEMFINPTSVSSDFIFRWETIEISLTLGKIRWQPQGLLRITASDVSELRIIAYFPLSFSFFLSFAIDENIKGKYRVLERIFLDSYFDGNPKNLSSSKLPGQYGILQLS